jgi:NAD(P)-dependent dehydrogenase (short-subunit alcohol dehydrogenase family)
MESLNGGESSFLIIPPWQLNYTEYVLLCQYIGVTPSILIYEQLLTYLEKKSFECELPKGFELYLAQKVPKLLMLGFLDQWTRLLFRRNPWRYKLNALIAIHECDGVGYEEMSRFSGGFLKTWFEITVFGVSVVLNIVFGGTWIMLQGGSYWFSKLFNPDIEKKISGKTILITGATKGLGLELTKQSLAAGARVIGVARTVEKFDGSLSLMRQVNSVYKLSLCAADISEPEAMESVLNDFALTPADIDIAILNAGIKQASVDFIECDAMRNTFEVNFWGAVQCADSFVKVWKSLQQQKNLIFVSSAGRWHGMPASGGYNASKAALSIFVDSLRLDLKKRGIDSIRITTIEPGLIHTGMVQQKGIQKLLSITSEKAAEKILKAIVQQKYTSKFPYIFVMFTFLIVAMGSRLRAFVLTQVK